MQPKSVVAADKILPRPTEPVKPAVVEQPKKKFWRFEKVMGPACPVPLSDGTTFKFPVKQRQDGQFHPFSAVNVEDSVLAGKLREAAKNPAHYIFEIPAKE